MLRQLITSFLMVAVVVYGQYGPQPAPQYPSQPYPNQQYPQQYPNQQYPSQQAQYPQGQPEDPNAMAQDQQHGVARLSIVQGDVNVRRGDTGELVAAIMNAPLMTQDHLQTSAGSRAEVELDSGNIVRLAPNTDLGFADVEYQRYQLQLGAGTICYRVLRNSNAQVEIDTPSIAIRSSVPQGEYRISVLDDGTTQITVRSGQAEIFSPRGSQSIAAGHTVLVRGNPSDPEFQQGYEVARDQFDDWCANRDQTLLASQSYRYVSQDVYGADDLDTYGKWVPSQYGNVWEPQPPVADWSPYSYGQWAWEPYYGWTWVDYAPWGWAPYHYGRWFWNGGFGWCWWPGAIAARAFWSPALVGFFGWGGGFGIGLGGLGWVALAPFELFHAWWHGGFGFRGDYGVLRGAEIARMYRNAAVRGGAMTAAYNSFGGPYHRFTAATRGQLANASLFRGQPVSPMRAGYQFSNRQAVANPRLAAAGNRQFFSHQQPRFQSGFAGSRVGAGQSSSRGVAPNLQGSYATRGNYGAAPNASGGWQRFGDPSRTSTYRQNLTGGQEQSGWHRFGEPQQPAASYARPNSSGAYSGNYQARPQSAPRSGVSGAYGGSYYGGARPNYSAPQPHYNAPSVHYSAPSAPHYSAPSSSVRGGSGSAPRSTGSFRGGGGGGGGHSGGGHSSSGGHHGR